MKTYKVIYTETVAYDFYIDAKNENDAKERFEQKLMNGEIDLIHGDICEADYVIEEEQTINLKCTDCAYCGDKYSFEQPNDLIDIDANNPLIKHYYCNCGDSKYYRQDVTGIETDDCEDFEEV
jgi:hypothetical protein